MLRLYQMRKLLILGRSPFINKIDLSKIDYNKFDVCCINYPIFDIRVHYVVSVDSWTKPILAPKTEWISSNTGWDFIKSYERKTHEEKRLSWACFSSSAAVSFAFLRGYKEVYLVGVDLKENNEPMKHYDGTENVFKTKASVCKKEKEYIAWYKDKIKIYQTNPDVKDEWDIPFMPISKLFS